MSRPTQPAKIEIVDQPGGPAERHTHPAFAQIGVSRVSGGTSLYGSDFEHQHFIRLRICASEFDRRLGRDWLYEKRRYIEVDMSEAQWATLLSTMNMGEGAPCTLVYRDGEMVPGIDRPRGTAADHERELREHVADMTRQVDDAIAVVEEELSTLSKKRRESVLKRLRMLRQDIRSNTPFVVKSFGEHMEQRTERAKMEVAAFMQGAIQRAGLDSLRGEAPALLASGDEVSDE